MTRRTWFMNMSPYPIKAAMKPSPKTNDYINHPNHYTWHPAAECKDIVGEFNYNLGTALAYIWRAPYKHDCAIEDLRKAIKHLEFECARLEERSQP